MNNEENNETNLSVADNTDLNQVSTENSASLLGTQTVGNEADTPEDNLQPEDESQKGAGIYANDGSYKVSDMNSRMKVELENEPDENSQPTQLQDDPSDIDLPYDVPDDQTPRMSDMPKNYEQYSQKNAPDHTKE